MAAGSYSVTSGRILIGDIELQKLPKHRIAHAGLSRTYQNIRLFDGMTVAQNLEVALVPPRIGSLLSDVFAFGGRSAAERRRECCYATLAKLGLTAYRRTAWPASLAYGQQKLVELARAIVSKPRVLLLDEPAAGLNHGETERLKEHILDLRTPELAMVLIEHDMKLIMSISDEIIVMNRGKVLAQGPPPRSAPTPACRRLTLASQVQSETSKPLLAVDGIESGYGRVKILHGISLRVMPGEVVCIIGPNGAGKTTLLRTLSGLCRPTRGSIGSRAGRWVGRAPPDGAPRARALS